MTPANTARQGRTPRIERSAISRSRRRTSPASLPGSWPTCPSTISPSPTRPSRLSSSRRLISKHYVQNPPTTLASQLGGTVAVPRQPDHVPALLASLAHHLSRRVDEHRPKQRQRE